MLNLFNREKQKKFKININESTVSFEKDYWLPNFSIEYELEIERKKLIKKRKEKIRKINEIDQ